MIILLDHLFFNNTYTPSMCERSHQILLIIDSLPPLHPSTIFLHLNSLPLNVPSPFSPPSFPTVAYFPPTTCCFIALVGIIGKPCLGWSSMEISFLRIYRFLCAVTGRFVLSPVDRSNGSVSAPLYMEEQVYCQISSKWPPVGYLHRSKVLEHPNLSIF